MHKNILLSVGISILFLGISIYPSSAFEMVKKNVNPLISNGNTLYVGGSGPGNYTKIQDAINNAYDGDTVFVYDDSSPYYENVRIYKPINLKGENKDTTIIDGNKLDFVIFITSPEVNISGFTIRNSKTGEDINSGILVWSSYNAITIFGNNIVNNYNGIVFKSGKRNIISNNNISNNKYYGIQNLYGYYSYINNNIIKSNGESGISISGKFNIISNNKIVSNNRDGITFSADYIDNPKRNYLIYKNEINSNKNYGIDGYSWYSSIIKNNIQNNGKYGLRIRWGGNNSIISNNFIGNKRHATFKFIGDPIEHNSWHQNYWDRPRFLPYPIFGRIGTFFGLIPWIQIDWYPAQGPYDI